MTLNFKVTHQGLSMAMFFAGFIWHKNIGLDKKYKYF